MQVRYQNSQEEKQKCRYGAQHDESLKTLAVSCFVDSIFLKLEFCVGKVSTWRVRICERVWQHLQRLSLQTDVLKGQLAIEITMSNDLKAEFREFVRESENTSRVITLWMDILKNQLATGITMSNDLKADFGEFVEESENASRVLL